MNEIQTFTADELPMPITRVVSYMPEGDYEPFREWEETCSQWVLAVEVDEDGNVITGFVQKVLDHNGKESWTNGYNEDCECPNVPLVLIPLSEEVKKALSECVAFEAWNISYKTEVIA